MFADDEQTTMRRAIIASVLASILFITFVQPVLGLAWRLALSNIKAFSNLTYRHASLGLREENGLALYVILSSLAVGFTTGFAASVYSSKAPAGGPPSGGAARRAGRSVLRFFLGSRTGVSLVLAGVLAMATLSVAVRFRDMQLNASFQQRLTVLAPHISDQQYKELMASWASMQSEEDFEAISSKMEALARSNGIRLPEPMSGSTTAMW